MELKDLKIGDIIEVSTNGESFLAEIFGLTNSQDPYPVKILMPRNARAGGFYESVDNSDYAAFSKNVDKTKLMQHKLYLISTREILKITDQRW